MSDRSKFSDATEDAEADKVAKELVLNDELKELNEKEQRLKRNIAALTAEIARAKKNPSAPSPSANNKIGARKDSSFKAISTAPSINKTPMGCLMVPVPYPVIQDLSNSMKTARTVNFNGCPAYVLDCSNQPRCTGDEPGTGKGIRSGTVSGEVKPLQGSASVRIEGKCVVRDGDACTMNGGNNPGIYTTAPITSSQSTSNASKSAISLASQQNLEIWASVKEWLHQQGSNLSAAIQHPLDGFKGAIKGAINTIPQTGEMFTHALIEQHASELEEGAVIQSLFSQGEAAKELRNIAAVSRIQSAGIDFKKLKMSNSAQDGGDLISTIIQVLFAGGAVSKVGGKVTRKLSNTARTFVEKDAQIGRAGSGNGVRISAKSGTHVIKSMSREDLEKWLREMHGISEKSKLDDMINSFDSSKLIELVELQKDTVVIQYVRENGTVGTFYAYPGTSPAELAISGDGRVLRTFTVSEPVQVLRGTAAEFPTGKYPGVGGPGGGIQLIAPRGSTKFIENTGR